jgi:hypothetical protein
MRPNPTFRKKLWSESNNRILFPNTAESREGQEGGCHKSSPNIGLQATANGLRSCVATAIGGA